MFRSYHKDLQRNQSIDVAAISSNLHAIVPDTSTNSEKLNVSLKFGSVTVVTDDLHLAQSKFLQSIVNVMARHAIIVTATVLLLMITVSVPRLVYRHTHYIILLAMMLSSPFIYFMFPVGTNGYYKTCYLCHYCCVSCLLRLNRVNNTTKIHVNAETIEKIKEMHAEQVLSLQRQNDDSNAVVHPISRTDQPSVAFN